MNWIFISVIALVVGYFAIQKFESMKCKSLEELRQMLLPESHYLFYHNAILELRRRGEDTSHYITLFPRLLSSSDRKVRVRGWAALEKLYPEKVAELPFNPFGSPEECAGLARQLEESLGDA